MKSLTVFLISKQNFQVNFLQVNRKTKTKKKTVHSKKRMLENRELLTVYIFATRWSVFVIFCPILFSSKGFPKNMAENCCCYL